MLNIISVDVSELTIRAERFVLYDLNGEKVKEFILSNSLSNIYNVNELNAGIYFYEILNNKNEIIHQGKVVK